MVYFDFAFFVFSQCEQKTQQTANVDCGEKCQFIYSAIKNVFWYNGNKKKLPKNKQCLISAVHPSQSSMLCLSLASL